MQKRGRQKVLTNFFLRSKTQIDGKLGPPIFLLRIRTKRPRMGPQWRFFRWLFIHLSLNWNHVQRMEYWQHTQFRATSKCFKSTLCLNWCSTEKLPFSSLRYVQDRLPWRTRPQACSISLSSPLNRPQYVCYGKPLKKHGDQASHWWQLWNVSGRL